MGAALIAEASWPDGSSGPQAREKRVGLEAQRTAVESYLNGGQVEAARGVRCGGER